MRPLFLLLLLAGCSAAPQIADAGATDEAAPGDVAAPADLGEDDGGETFFCNMAQCDSRREFCYRVLSGARSVVDPPGPEASDGGVMRGCNPLPPTCGGEGSCDCVKRSIDTCPPLSLTCQRQGGGLHVFCSLP